MIQETMSNKTQNKENTKTQTKRNKLGRQGKLWTEEELEYLNKNYAKMSVKNLAKKLQRTEISILRKLDVEAGSRKLSVIEGFFTTKELADILKVSDDTVARWIRLHAFPANIIKNKSFDDLNNKSRMRYLIDPSEVWEWVEHNRDKMNVFAYEIERGVILPEPQWFIDDVNNKVWYGRNEIWTDEMKAKLYKLRFVDELKLKECAEVFGKNVPAIQKQLGKINRMKISEINTLIKHAGF